MEQRHDLTPGDIITAVYLSVPLKKVHFTFTNFMNSQIKTELYNIIEIYFSLDFFLSRTDVKQTLTEYNTDILIDSI